MTDHENFLIELRNFSAHLHAGNHEGFTVYVSDADRVEVNLFGVGLFCGERREVIVEIREEMMRREGLLCPECGAELRKADVLCRGHCVAGCQQRGV